MTEDKQTGNYHGEARGTTRLCYQRELADSSTYVGQDQSTSEKKASATVECTSMEQEEDDDEIEYEYYDESTDEEGSASENSDDENGSGNVMSNEIDKSATFHLGRTTRYRRAVRFNSPLFSNKVRS